MKMKKCPICLGSGKGDKFKWDCSWSWGWESKNDKDCEKCNGTGEVPDYKQ